MKTKFFLLSVLFLFIGENAVLHAQKSQDSSWFMDGSQWYYYIADDGMGSGEGCIRMSLAGDTLLGEHVCQRLMMESCDGSYETIYEYVYSVGEKLFYYNVAAKDFFMLLDLSAQPGDTVWVHTESFVPNPGFDPYRRWEKVAADFSDPSECFPFMAYKIDSVDTLNIGGKTLKRQSAQPVTNRTTEHGEENSLWMFPGWHHEYIIEGIGSLGGFFGEVWGLYPEWGKCQLRCFSVNGQNYISNGECGNTSIERPQTHEKEIWRLSPQPATGVVRVYRISTDDRIGESGRWRLFNLAGKIIQNGTFVNGSFVISVEDNPSGLYFMEIDAGKGNICRLKCITIKR